jgi:hypothetical protein
MLLSFQRGSLGGARSNPRIQPSGSHFGGNVSANVNELARGEGPVSRSDAGLDANLHEVSKYQELNERSLRHDGRRELKPADY